MSKIKIEYTSRFIEERKKFVKNNRIRLKGYSKAVKLFLRNPNHPSLQLEKLKNSPYWTIRLNKSDRVFLIWSSKTLATFLDIGPHDKYRRY